MQNLLYVYLSKKTGISIPAQGFRLPGSEIPASETGDPFAAVDTDSIRQSGEYRRYHLSA